MGWVGFEAMFAAIRTWCEGVCEEGFKASI